MQRAIIVLLLVALLAAVSWPLLDSSRILITDDVVVSDAAGAGLPFRSVVHAALRGRASPFWCPGIYCGFPLHGDPDAGLLSPLSWVLAVLPDPVTAAQAGIFLDLLLAALGVVLLLRDERADLLPALYGGLAFAAGGFCVSHWKHFALLGSAVWLPWLLAGVGRLDDPGRRRSGFWLVALAAAGLGFGGHPQIIHLGALVAVAASLLLPLLTAGWRRPRLPARAWRPPLLVVAALALGLSVAGINLLPAADSALRSERAAERGPGLATRIELDARDLATWVDAGAVGSTGEGTYRGRGLFWEDYAYQGMLALPLALLGLAATRRRRRSWLWLALGAVSVVMALGSAGGLLPLALRLVPGMELLRFPQRYLVVAQLAVAVLAAHGVQALAGWITRRRAPRLAAGVLLLVLLVDLAAAQRVHNAFAPRARWLRAPATARQVAARGGRYLTLGAREAHRFAHRRARGWADVEWYVRQRGFLQPSTNLHFGVDAATGYANPVPASIVGLWGDQYAPGLLQSSYVRRGTAVTLEPLFFKLMAMAGVRTVLSFWPLDDPRLRPLPARRPVFAYAFEGWLPHARVVTEAVGARSLAAALAAVADPAVDPARRVVLLAEAAMEAPRAGRAAAPARVEVLARRDAELRCRVRLDAPGYLVIAESYDPGWRATVDGEDRPVLQADVAFQAVALGAGPHSVRLVYRPRLLAAGAGLSSLGLLLVVAAAAAATVCGRRQSRCKSPT